MEKNPRNYIYIYLRLNHSAVYLKPTQHYKSTILQFLKKGTVCHEHFESEGCFLQSPYRGTCPQWTGCPSFSLNLGGRLRTGRVAVSVAELGRQRLSQARRQNRSSASVSPGPSWPTVGSPPALCPGWNLEEEGAASEPQKGLHWGSWTKSFTNHHQVSLSWMGDEDLTEWQTLRLQTVLSLFNHSVVSDSLQPRGLQHHTSLSFTVSQSSSNSCPLSRWCHPAISSSVVPFSSCLQSFPASGSFPMSQFFTSAGQSIGASASASVLPMNIQDWSPLEWTGWISLLSKGLSTVFSNTTGQKHQFFSAQPSLWSNSHIHTRQLEKPQFWLDGPLSAKWCLCFLIRCVIFIHLFSNQGSERSWPKVATTCFPHCTLYFLHGITTVCDYLASLFTFSLSPQSECKLSVLLIAISPMPSSVPL